MLPMTMVDYKHINKNAPLLKDPRIIRHKYRNYIMPSKRFDSADGAHKYILCQHILHNDYQ